MSTHQLFIPAPPGCAEALAGELAGIVGAKVPWRPGGVPLEGSLELGYRICLWSRVANRVLLSLREVQVEQQEGLYDAVREVCWDEHLAADGSLAVDWTGSHPQFTNSIYACQRVKDAIVDQLREKHGTRPSVDLEQPDLRLLVHADGERLSFYVDLSGGGLHRRGYRQTGGKAPLKENVAAAGLLMAGWPELARDGAPLVDPMCGSGTFLIEGALIAAGRAPALSRRWFGFEGWRGHDAEVWHEILAEAREQAASSSARMPRITGCDTDAGAVAGALANVERAGLAGKVHVERRDLTRAGDLLAHNAEPGLVVVNPPYGERLGGADLPMLLGDLGATLRGQFPGWRTAILTAVTQPPTVFGLGVMRERPLRNGPIACRLLLGQIEEPKRAGAALIVGGDRTDSGTQELGDFGNRLRKNLRHLRRWLQREEVACFRCYDADLPEYNVAVDIYDQLVHVQEYRAPTDVDTGKAGKRLQEIRKVLPRLLDVPSRQIFVKQRRRQRGAEQYQKQASRGVFHEVREGDLRFLINLDDYLDSGLFLDQRLTRRWIGELASGKRFLNLFSYTATASVAAALGGARSTTSVDLSRTYQAWAGRNLERNRIAGKDHQLVCADCRQWLEQDRGQYDLIFLDPPSFSNSKKTPHTLDVQRDHLAMIRRVLPRLAQDGVLLFSTNRRGFKLDIAALTDLAVEDRTSQTVPPDFSRRPRIHQLWMITRQR